MPKNQAAAMRLSQPAVDSSFADAYVQLRICCQDEAGEEKNDREAGR